MAIYSVEFDYHTSPRPAPLLLRDGMPIASLTGTPNTTTDETMALTVRIVALLNSAEGPHRQ